MATGVGIPEIRAAAARSEVKHSPVRARSPRGTTLPASAHRWRRRKWTLKASRVTFPRRHSYAGFRASICHVGATVGFSKRERRAWRYLQHAPPPATGAPNDGAIVAWRVGALRQSLRLVSVGQRARQAWGACPKTPARPRLAGAEHSSSAGCPALGGAGRCGTARCLIAPLRTVRAAANRRQRWRISQRCYNLATPDARRPSAD